MAEVSEIAAANQTAVSDVEVGKSDNNSRRPESLLSVSFFQKLIGEMVGTFSLVFAGCAAVVVNETYGKVVTLPGVALAWGLTVMVMIYSIGHVSGAHFNPAVSIAFASSRRFPPKQVPAYIAAQVLGSTLAAVSLRLAFHLNDDVCSGKGDIYVGTYPSGSKTTSFVMEFIATFYLMFVISAVATDERAAGSFAGVAIGSTITLDILFMGPISGPSMNPARSLGPAIIWSCYKDLWIYMISTVLGAVSGAWIYDILRSTDRTFKEIIHSDCGKISSGNISKETSQNDICVLRMIDPVNKKYFICSSPFDISEKLDVSCKFE